METTLAVTISTAAALMFQRAQSLVCAREFASRSARELEPELQLVARSKSATASVSLSILQWPLLQSALVLELVLVSASQSDSELQ